MYYPQIRQIELILNKGYYYSTKIIKRVLEKVLSKHNLTSKKCLTDFCKWKVAILLSFWLHNVCSSKFVHVDQYFSKSVLIFKITVIICHIIIFTLNINLYSFKAIQTQITSFTRHDKPWRFRSTHLYFSEGTLC